MLNKITRTLLSMWNHLLFTVRNYLSNYLNFMKQYAIKIDRSHITTWGFSASGAFLNMFRAWVESLIIMGFSVESVNIILLSIA